MILAKLNHLNTVMLGTRAQQSVVPENTGQEKYASIANLIMSQSIDDKLEEVRRYAFKLGTGE